MTLLDFLEGTASLLLIAACVVVLTTTLGRDHANQDPYRDGGEP